MASGANSTTGKAEERREAPSLVLAVPDDEVDHKAHIRRVARDATSPAVAQDLRRSAVGVFGTPQRYFGTTRKVSLMLGTCLGSSTACRCYVLMRRGLPFGCSVAVVPRGPRRLLPRNELLISKTAHDYSSLGNNTRGPGEVKPRCGG